MKNNNFYHTSVDIHEYPFDAVYLTELTNELINNIKIFNNSKNVQYKKELAQNIPLIFPTCRLCGETIINDNFRIKIDTQQNYIQLINPRIYCREINGHKYYLSCCEQCLLNHFKDNPPKSTKYYFMKANKYGQYSFGYSDEEYHKICSMTVGVTKQSMIRKWGEIEGENRWKEYCSKQAFTNSFDYKHTEHGWSKEQFDDFNKKRAVTLENLINKYGSILGTQKFNDYVNKQKLTKSEDYMIVKYGKEKTKQINKSKGLTLENFINRLGIEEGTKQFKIAINKHRNYFSKISQKFFDELDKYLCSKYTTYYATKNNEYGVMLNDNKYIRLDYFILELNICIEFNGTYYHGDPKIFKENDCPNPHRKTLTAKEIWEQDNYRYKLLEEQKNIKTIIVWEQEYYDGINIKDFIKNKLNITI